jgi:hypothetical protein
MGFGPAQSLYSLAVQNSVPPQELGQATSASQFTRQIGSTIGAAVMGAIFSAALGAALVANMPASGAMPPGGVAAGMSRVNSKGLTEIRAEIEAGFDQRIAAIEKLFSLRGPEARAALDALVADSALSAEMRTNLAGGTPAMQIDAAFLSLGDSIEKAISSSDARAIAGILAGPQIDALMSAEQKGRIVALPYAPPPVRAKALLGIRSGLSAAADAAVIKANAAALGPIREEISKAKIEAADAVVKGMRKSFSDSIHQVWIISIIVMTLMLLLTLLIPDVPLKAASDPDGAGS